MGEEYEEHPDGAPPAPPGRGARKRRLKRRRRGCFTLLLAIALLALAVLIWRDREALFRDGRFQFRQFARSLFERGRDLRKVPPQEMLDRLRDKVAAIQERGEQFVDSGEMREMLDDLRADLEKKRDGAAGMASGQWDDLVARGERLVDKAKESEAWKKGQELPKEIRDLQTILGQLRDLAESQKVSETEAEEKESPKP